ncbi:MAG TPA: hypothetical protein VI758_06470, partial [Bacteroidota bacterium]
MSHESRKKPIRTAPTANTPAFPSDGTTGELSLVRALLESLTAAIYVKDRGGRFLVVNEVAARLL